MRKIIESALVSLDGVFGDPHVWATEYFDQEAEGYALELLSSAEAMLMGRRTYEFFAAAFPHRTGAYGDRINAIPKYVFSNTLKKADWNNSTIIGGDVLTEAAKLKQQDGDDLVIYVMVFSDSRCWKAAFSMRSSCGSIRSWWAEV